MKKCTKCGEEKELSADNFTIRKDRPCGYSSSCKACQRGHRKSRAAENREYAAKYYAKNKSEMLAYNKRYRQTEAERLAHRKRERVYARTHAKEHRARSAVSNALVSGRINRGGCEYPDGKCSGRIEAHHSNYSKPLDVIWFCKKHHVLADKIYKLTQAIWV